MFTSMMGFMIAGRTLSLFTTQVNARQSIARCGVCSSLNAVPSRALHGLIAAKSWNVMLISNSPVRVTKSLTRVAFGRGTNCRSSIKGALSLHRAHTWEGMDGATGSESRLTTTSWLVATESRSSLLFEKGDRQNFPLRASGSSSKSNRASSPGRRGGRVPGNIRQTSESRVAGGRGPATTGTGGRCTGQTATIRVDGVSRGPGNARGEEVE